MDTFSTLKTMWWLLRKSNFSMRDTCIIFIGAVLNACGDAIFLFSFYIFLNYLSTGNLTLIESINIIGLNLENDYVVFNTLSVLLILTFLFRILALRITFIFLEKSKRDISNSFIYIYLSAKFSDSSEIDEVHLTKLLTNDIDLILFNGYQQVFIFIQNLLSILIICTALGTQHPMQLLLSGCLLFILYFVLYRSINHIISNNSHKIANYNLQRGEILGDIGKTQRETRILGLAPFYRQDFLTLTESLFKMNSLNSFLGGFPKILLETTALLGFIGLAAYYSAGDKVAVYELILAFGISAFRLLPAFQGLYTSVVSINIVSATMKNFADKFQILLQSAKTNLSEFNGPYTSDFYSIELQNISAKINGNVLFQSFSAHVKKGDFVKIKGPSGSGKSTLVDGLMGFRELDRGTIETKTIEGLPPKFSYVTQQPAFMSGPVERNLSLDQLNPLGKQKALRLLHELGLSSSLKLKEVKNLSGGQIQRLAIVRALIRDADIYVFDEVLSALDDATSELVQKTLRRELQGKTVFWISHGSEPILEATQVWMLKPELRQIRV